MPGLVSASVLRKLKDSRGRINASGDNPIRHDTFFLNVNRGDFATIIGDVTAQFVVTVPPDSVGISGISSTAGSVSSSSKLVNIYGALKTANAGNMDWKQLSVTRFPFNSGGNSFGAADVTAGAGADDLIVAPDAVYYNPTHAGAAHRMASSANIILIRQPILSTATQLTVKPLDVLLISIVITHVAVSTVSLDINLEFSRQSI